MKKYRPVKRIQFTPKMLKLKLKHGAKTYKIELVTDSKLCDLLSASEEETGVPAKCQKLIRNGKTLAFTNLDVTLAELGLKSGDKVMVLGKKPDVENDERYKKILEIEAKSQDLMSKIRDVDTEVTDIEKGFLEAKSDKTMAVKGLRKRCAGSQEALMKHLEALDAIQVNASQSTGESAASDALKSTSNDSIRSKRKRVVDDVNKMMDYSDKVLNRIEKLQ